MFYTFINRKSTQSGVQAVACSDSLCNLRLLSPHAPVS